MEVINIINKFEDAMEEASTLPFSSKKIIDKDLIEAFLEEIRCHLPEDIKKAKWIQDERTKILADTKAERERILLDTQETVTQMVADHEIVRIAQEDARQKIEEATEKAMRIESGAKQYASGILDEMQHKLQMKLEEIEKNKRELENF